MKPLTERLRQRGTSKALGEAIYLGFDAQEVFSNLWPSVMYGDFRSLYREFYGFETPLLEKMLSGKPIRSPLDPQGELDGNDVAFDECMTQNQEFQRFLASYKCFPENGLDVFYHDIGFDIGAALYKAETGGRITPDYIKRFFLQPCRVFESRDGDNPFVYYFIVKKDLKRKGYQAGLSPDELRELIELEESFTLSEIRKSFTNKKKRKKKIAL